MCSSKELLCARVVCDCAKHHVHAVNGTRATNSIRFFKELHVPSVSVMVHSSPHQPLQFGKSRLAGSSCHILRVTVYTHHTHTDKLKKASDHCPPNTHQKVCCHTCGSSPVPCIASTNTPQSCSNHLSRHRQVQRKSLGSSRPRDRLT